MTMSNFLCWKCKNHKKDLKLSEQGGNPKKKLENVGTIHENYKVEDSPTEWTYLNIIDNIMFCWGGTIHGQLGLGGIEEDQIFQPKELKFQDSTNIRHVACGQNHTVMVSNAGAVYSCGNNDHGQLGHGKSRTKPEKVEGLDAYHIEAVSCGGSHTLAFNEWGQLFGWGSDVHGQLGLNVETQTTPKIVKSLATSHIVQISCGQNHSLALTNCGKLFAWGGNGYGQLGVGTLGGDHREPLLVQSLYGIPISFIACGSNHSFAVSKSGAVFAWGKNAFGQLGLNDQEDRKFPTQLKTMRSIGIRVVSCGEEFSAFLTKDGGVFTCGAGMYGQLGHGSNSNEILPRKVMELMGSTVTQISCGRRHTLALVPSRGRVYAFGLGGTGQLGTKTTTNSNTPQVVLGPWASPSGVQIVSTSTPGNESCRVIRIFAGGDQSFVTVAPFSSDSVPVDQRVLKQLTQVLSIQSENINRCVRVDSQETVDQDLMLYLETVFRHQPCVNSSFLLSNDRHECCTSKHHGVDMRLAESVFADVSRIENESISELIWDSVINYLLPSLHTSPPDVETLRIYLVLPLYHQFENPKHGSMLQCALAKTFLNLKSEAAKIVGMWWSSMSVDYFERLIRIYKDIVAYQLRPIKPTDMNVFFDESLVTALNMLNKLNELNRSVDYLKVPYDSFYIPELRDSIDIHRDYMKWLQDEGPRFGAKKLFFCNYPFVFDAQTKTMLLQFDQWLQMQTAMSQVTHRMIAQLLLGPPMAFAEEQFIYLMISRESIVQSTVHQLMQLDTSELKKPLKIKFIGEEAEDAGGVRKEFFMLVLREVLDPKYGMFRNYEETRTIWFSEDSFEDEGMYYLIGLLCGLAIYNFTIIDLPFPLALYKKLLKETLSLQDLNGLSPVLAKSMQDLLDYTGEDLTDVFCLNFEITREVYGEVKTIPLKENGANVHVTQQNKKEFVDLYVDMLLNKSVSTHYNAFHEGFHKVCGGRVLELFHSHELMTLVVGNENYDWEEFEANAEYKNGYSKDDLTIKLFWEVFHELTLEDKKNFLLFLTGSDRIPILGMKDIQIFIQPTQDDKYLPVAHTCFNLLDLPRYRTKERLKYKLLQAIKQNLGFSLV